MIYMNLRERFDENGNWIGSHMMIFDSIPDDYVVNTIFDKDNKYTDLSYLGVFRSLKAEYADKELKGYDLGIEFQDEDYVRREIFRHLSLDYLNSARYLWNGVNSDRGQDVVTYYVIPCAFLCKHSIELFLKTCMLYKGISDFKGHSIKKLWEKLDEKEIPQYRELSDFIGELEKVDNNEMALR